MLVKKMGYYYDNQAVAEPSKSGYKGSAFNHAKTLGHQSGHGRSKPSSNARIETDTRNSRNIWSIPTEPSREGHFALMPSALADKCIRAGCPVGGVVLDPFSGAGTTALAANRVRRHAVLVELNPDYAAIAQRRLATEGFPVTVSAMPTAATATMVPPMSRAA